MAYTSGDLLNAEWDGDGSWRILRVTWVEDETIHLELFENSYTARPSLEDVERDRVIETHALESDELALRWPSPLEAATGRSTRRGLFQDLLVNGIEKGEEIARKRKPWRF